MKRNILFLDIDGVLNGHEFSEEAQSCTLKPACVEAFNRLLREGEKIEGFGIVVSSAWRYMVFRESMTWVGFGHMLQTHGVSTRFATFLCGCTWRHILRLR